MEGEPEDFQKVPRLPGQMTHGDFLVPFGGESDRQAYYRFAKEIDDIISSTLASNILVWLMEGYYGCIIYPRRRSVRQKIVSVLKIVVYWSLILFVMM